MSKKKYMVKPEDFAFKNKKQRELAAKLVNKPSKAVTHSTRNTGSWIVPVLDDDELSPAAEWVLRGGVAQ